MEKIVIHISDLHFGAHNDETAARLLVEINEATPALCIISGDLTQTGSRREFLQARKFIDGINSRVLCVPGNHDIPHFNLWQRFAMPFRRYKRYITENLCPVEIDENFVVAGINTARPVLPHWNWAHGWISARQRKNIRRAFAADHGDKIRIFVCHHPLHEAAGVPLKVLVWGGRKALEDLFILKTDLILTGHAHHASVTILEEQGRRLAAVAASTAISTRLRKQENGYNLLHIGKGRVRIETMRWNGRAYEPLQQTIFSKQESA